MALGIGMSRSKYFLVLTREFALGVIGLISGGAVVAASWALAGPAGLPGSLHELVGLHRSNPVLLLVDLIPLLSTAAGVACARKIGSDDAAAPAAADPPREEPAPREVPLVPRLAQALIYVDHEGRIIEANPTVEAIFGRSAEEVRGAIIELLLPDGLDGLAGAECVRNSSGQVIGRRWETEGRDADGVELALVVSTPAQRTSRGTWISVELPATAGDADTPDERDRLPDARFLNGLVREIRAPANVATAYAEFAAEQAAAMGLGGCVADLERIRSLTRRLRIVADDLVELAKIAEGGEPEVLLQAVELRQLVDEAAQDAVRLDAQVRGVEQRPVTLHGATLMVRADSEKLRVVVLHLVMSLCPFARPGTIRIVLTPRGGTTAVSVTGDIVAGDLVVDTPGLQLCRWLVAAMGGRLDHPDPGTWSLELPSHQGPTSTIDEARTRPLGVDWDDVLRAHRGARSSDSVPEPDREAEAPIMAPRILQSAEASDRPEGRVRVLYVDPDVRGRERFISELAARGVGVGAVSGPERASSLVTLPDTKLLVIRSGGVGVWSFLRFLQADPVLASLPPALVDLAGGVGHVLRVDSIMERSHATERLSVMCTALGVGITGPRAFVLAEVPAVRRALEVGLRRAGWRCAVSASNQELADALAHSSIHLVIVDGAHPESGAALAALYRAGRRVSHVSLLLPARGLSPELTVPSEARVCTGQVYDDLVRLARRRRVDLLPSLEWA